MKSFSDLLSRFKGLVPPDKTIREAVAKVIFEKMGIDVPIKNITLQNKTIFIQENPAVKTSIFIKKQYLLKELELNFHEKAPKDIR